MATDMAVARGAIGLLCFGNFARLFPSILNSKLVAVLLGVVFHPAVNLLALDLLATLAKGATARDEFENDASFFVSIIKLNFAFS